MELLYLRDKEVRNKTKESRKGKTEDRKERRRRTGNLASCNKRVTERLVFRAQPPLPDQSSKSSWLIRN